MQKAIFLIRSKSGLVGSVAVAASLLLSPSLNEAASPTQAAPGQTAPALKKTAPKSGVPQIYEKEESGKSFTDVVKFVRPGEDTIEVVFEKQQGLYYVAQSEALLRDLRKSQKDKTPVAVKVDDDDRILSANLQKSATPPEDTYDEKELQKLMKSINKN